MAPIEFTLADKTQHYVRKLAEQLSALDGEPLFFVHDGSSGTSDEIVSPMAGSIQMGQPIEDAPLFLLLTALSKFACVVRIWLADNTSNSHLRVSDCHSLENMMGQFREQSQRAGFVGIRTRFSGHG